MTQTATTTTTAPAQLAAGDMTISSYEVIENIITIRVLRAENEAQAAELSRLRAELEATTKQLKRQRNYAAAVSQPGAYGVGR
jgi:hypothetical protein